MKCFMSAKSSLTSSRKARVSRAVAACVRWYGRFFLRRYREGKLCFHLQCFRKPGHLRLNWRKPPGKMVIRSVGETNPMIANNLQSFFVGCRISLPQLSEVLTMAAELRRYQRSPLFRAVVCRSTASTPAAWTRIIPFHIGLCTNPWVTRPSPLIVGAIR